MSGAAKPTRADYRHFVPLTVRWGDMDALGHVNNVKFFTYDEQARLLYFDAIGTVVPDFWKSSGLILARIGCYFLEQVRFPAQLDVGLRVARIGRSSMETEASMFLGDKPVAITKATVVWFDYLNQKSAAVPEVVREFIRGFEAVAPVEG